MRIRHQSLAMTAIFALLGVISIWVLGPKATRAEPNTRFELPAVLEPEHRRDGETDALADLLYDDAIDNAVDESFLVDPEDFAMIELDDELATVGEDDPARDEFRGDLRHLGEPFTNQPVPLIDPEARWVDLTTSLNTQAGAVETFDPTTFTALAGSQAGGFVPQVDLTSTAIPEPGAFMLLIGGALLAMTRRTRPRSTR